MKKYGWYIFFFLLTVFCAFLIFGDGLISRVFPMATEALPEETPQPTAEQTAEPSPEPTPEPTPAPNPEPTPKPEPETVPGRVTANGVGAVYCRLDRGAQLVIIDETEAFYRVDMGGVTGLVEKQFLRPDDETAPEERTVYARENLSVFPTVYREGEPVARAGFNEALTALDAFGEYLLVEKGGVSGYILASQVGDWPITYSDSGSGDSGDSGGGADGGDIQLGFAAGQTGAFVRLASSRPAQVLGDGVELYLAVLSREDTVKVLSRGDGLCTLYFDGLTAQVPDWAVQLPEDEPYEEWDGYAAKRMSLYADWRMRVPACDVGLNTQLHVLQDFGDLLLVSLEDALYYVPEDSISRSYIQYNYNPGGSSGSSSGESSGGEWTEPVL